MIDYSNPLLQDWQTPYQLPPFEQIRFEHFAPAFAVLFEQHLKEIDVLAANPASPTFDNTVVPFDAAGARLNSVRLTFENLCASESPAALQAVEREMAPLLAEHDSKVAMHAGFFARLDALHRQAAALDLNEEQHRLLQRVHTDFVRTGAALEGAARERFAAIAMRLADLYTQFAQNVLADESTYQLRLTSEADLAGLPEFVREAARGAARERGVDGLCDHAVAFARGTIPHVVVPPRFAGNGMARMDEPWRNPDPRQPAARSRNTGLAAGTGAIARL